MLFSVKFVSFHGRFSKTIYVHESESILILYHLVVCLKIAYGMRLTSNYVAQIGDQYF